MKSFVFCAILLCLCQSLDGYALTSRKEETVYDTKYNECDPSTIPVMSSFDMNKFSGKWYELAKTPTGYIDVTDGVWNISVTDTGNTFSFSGRDNNQHCIRPMTGHISVSEEPPGTLTLKYKTYATYVQESVRVLFTDYASLAVVYACMHVRASTCAAAGLVGVVWTRAPHVDVRVFDTAAQYLNMACVHKSTLQIRNVAGPCRIDDLDTHIDDFPAPEYCYQPKDLGSCRGSIQRFYFDSQERDCKPFFYGGCEGNKNNFMSMAECHQKCISDSKREPVCLSTAKCALHCSPCCFEDSTGCVQCSCDEIVEDIFVNCIKEPFECPADCTVDNHQSDCPVCRCDFDSLPGVCNEPKAIGKCHSNIERFYFNQVSGECENFNFTGCYGNNNNFRTALECQITCKGFMSEPLAGNAVYFSSWLLILTTAMLFLY